MANAYSIRILLLNKWLLDYAILFDLSKSLSYLYKFALCRLRLVKMKAHIFANNVNMKQGFRNCPVKTANLTVLFYSKHPKVSCESIRVETIRGRSSETRVFTNDESRSGISYRTYINVQSIFHLQLINWIQTDNV